MRLIGLYFSLQATDSQTVVSAANAPTVSTWLPDRRNFGSLSRPVRPESFFDWPNESELAAARLPPPPRKTPCATQKLMPQRLRCACRARDVLAHWDRENQAYALA